MYKDHERFEPDVNSVWWMRAVPGNLIAKLSRLCRRYVVLSVWFDHIIMIVILANCVLMATEKPGEDAYLPWAETAFTWIFIVTNPLFRQFKKDI